jgi:hypothetical protein
VQKKLNSPPVCGTSLHNGASIRSDGRSGICDSRTWWSQPNMSKAAYIYGDLVVDYGTTKKSSQDATYHVEAAVRYHNTLELSACGKRECRNDCVGNSCTLQYCGYDESVVLKTNREMVCDVQTGPSSTCIGFPASRWGSDDKNVRLRSQVIGNKVCVFLDMSNAGATTGDVYRKSRRDGEKGHLDRYSLLDDNTKETVDECLLQEDCPTGVTKKCPEGIRKCSLKPNNKVFGEKLISDLGCPTDPANFQYNMTNEGREIIERRTEELKVNEFLTLEDKAEINKLKSDLAKCRQLAINVNTKEGSWTEYLALSERWFAIDVVQYIGNNQPEGSPRGYYDVNGNFFPEQQCMKIRLAIGPQKFYKYATMENTPKLYLPVLYIDGVIRQCSIKKEDTNECESADIGDIENTLVSFIDPGVVVKYGNNAKLSYIPFGILKAPSGRSRDDYTKIEARDNKNVAEYFLEKIYEYGQAKLCLYKLGFSKGRAVNARVKCVSRNKPSARNLIIMPGEGSDYNQGRIKALFVENRVEDAPCTGFSVVNRCIQIDESDKINNVKYVDIQPKDKDNEAQDYIKIGGIGIGEAYAIKVGYSNDNCSKLANECIANRINLFKEKVKNNPDSVQLGFYQGFENQCKTDIARRCNFLKSEDNAYGYYHLYQMWELHTLDSFYFHH